MVNARRQDLEKILIPVMQRGLLLALICASLYRMIALVGRSKVLLSLQNDSAGRPFKGSSSAGCFCVRYAEARHSAGSQMCVVSVWVTESVSAPPLGIPGT